MVKISCPYRGSSGQEPLPRGWEKSKRPREDRGLLLWCGSSVYGSGLEASVPISVGTVTDSDEARDEDRGSGSECDECEVHGYSPVARATGQAGNAALYYSVMNQNVFRAGGGEI